MYGTAKVVVDHKPCAMVYTARMKFGYNQEGFAKRFGISKYELSQIENYRKNPSEDLLRKIAASCDLTLDQMYMRAPIAKCMF